MLVCRVSVPLASGFQILFSCGYGKCYGHDNMLYEWAHGCSDILSECVSGCIGGVLL